MIRKQTLVLWCLSLLREALVNGGLGTRTSTRFLTARTGAKKPKASKSQAPPKRRKPNVLFITTDQQRFDALRIVQEELPLYRNKLKIRTETLDRLARSGVRFRNAYCQVPSCAPARTTLFTGCTSERTGVQVNELIKKKIYSRMPHFEKKINAFQTIEELLVEKEGYAAAHLGKFHLPGNHMSSKIYRYNSYDFAAKKARFSGGGDNAPYRKALLFVVRKYKISEKMKKGEVKDPRSGFPMQRIELSAQHGFSQMKGWGDLDSEYSSSALLSKMAVGVLNQLKEDGDPFILKLSKWWSCYKFAGSKRSTSVY